MTNKFFVKQLGRRILYSLAEFFNTVYCRYLLAHKVDKHICRQAVFGIVKPLENVGIFKICNTNGSALIVNLGRYRRNNILALVFRKRA